MPLERHHRAFWHSLVCWWCDPCDGERAQGDDAEDGDNDCDDNIANGGGDGNVIEVVEWVKEEGTVVDDDDDVFWGSCAVVVRCCEVGESFVSAPESATGDGHSIVRGLGLGWIC